MSIEKYRQELLNENFLGTDKQLVQRFKDGLVPQAISMMRKSNEQNEDACSIALEVLFFILGVLGMLALITQLMFTKHKSNFAVEIFCIFASYIIAIPVFLLKSAESTIKNAFPDIVKSLLSAFSNQPVTTTAALSAIAQWPSKLKHIIQNIKELKKTFCNPENSFSKKISLLSKFLFGVVLVTVNPIPGILPINNSYKENIKEVSKTLEREPQIINVYVQKNLNVVKPKKPVRRGSIAAGPLLMNTSGNISGGSKFCENAIGLMLTFVFALMLGAFIQCWNTLGPKETEKIFNMESYMEFGPYLTIQKIYSTLNRERLNKFLYRILKKTISFIVESLLSIPEHLYAAFTSDISKTVSKETMKIASTAAQKYVENNKASLASQTVQFFTNSTAGTLLVNGVSTVVTEIGSEFGAFIAPISDASNVAYDISEGNFNLDFITKFTKAVSSLAHSLYSVNGAFAIYEKRKLEIFFFLLLAKNAIWAFLLASATLIFSIGKFGLQTTASVGLSLIKTVVPLGYSAMQTTNVFANTTEFVKMLYNIFGATFGKIPAGFNAMIKTILRLCDTPLVKDVHEDVHDHSTQIIPYVNIDTFLEMFKKDPLIEQIIHAPSFALSNDFENVYASYQDEIDAAVKKLKEKKINYYKI